MGLVLSSFFLRRVVGLVINPFVLWVVLFFPWLLHVRGCRKIGVLVFCFLTGGRRQGTGMYERMLLGRNSQRKNKTASMGELGTSNLVLGFKEGLIQFVFKSWVCDFETCGSSGGENYEALGV